MATVVCLVAGGCTLTVDGEPVVEVSDFLALSRAESKADPNQEVVAGNELTRKYRMSKREKEIWNDPSFRKRFIESYIAETEVEPPMRDMERERMGEIYPLLEGGKLDQAESLLKKYRGKTASAAFDFTLGNIYFQREQIDQAVAAYRTAVRKYPKFRRAWRNLGLIYVRFDDMQNHAVGALTRVIELGGGDGVIYGLLGFAYSRLEKDVSAESAYRMAILMDPNTTDWKRGLAGSFFRQKRFREAAAICDRLLQGDPDNADIWMLQANAFIGMNKPLKAAENYEFVDRLGKSTLGSVSMLGDIYINQKLYGMASDSYVRALQMTPQVDPNDPNAVPKTRRALDKNTNRAIQAARVMAANGALDSTEAIVEGLREHRSKYLDKSDRKDLLRLEARIAVSRGARGRQVEVLKEIVALDPRDGEALMLLANHYANAPEAERNIEQAVFYYERAEGIEEFEADAKVQHAQLLVRQEKYAKAIPLLKSAQKIKYREDVQKYLEQVQRIAKSR